MVSCTGYSKEKKRSKIKTSLMGVAPSGYQRLLSDAFGGKRYSHFLAQVYYEFICLVKAKGDDHDSDYGAGFQMGR